MSRTSAKPVSAALRKIVCVSDDTSISRKLSSVSPFLGEAQNRDLLSVDHAHFETGILRGISREILRYVSKIESTVPVLVVLE